MEVLINGNGVELNARDDDDRSALWYAVYHGMRAAAQQLCQAGANINQLDQSGLSPLKLGIRKMDMAIVKFFLKHSEDALHTPRHQVGARPEFDQSTLFLASSIGDGSMFQLLLRCGIHPNTRNEYEESPLHLAATFGHVLAIEVLLSEPGIDVNTRDDIEATALWRASQQDHYQVAKRLLTGYDVEVNVVAENRDISERTSLHHAAQHGNERLIYLLLQQKAIDPNITDRGGMTPLAETACRGSLTIVRLLLKHKHINVETPEKGNPTPLCQAAKAGHATVVKELLTHPNININGPNGSYDGSSALLIAARAGSVEIIDLLVQDVRVNPHCVDRYGKTALWW